MRREDLTFSVLAAMAEDQLDNDGADAYMTDLVNGIEDAYEQYVEMLHGDNPTPEGGEGE